MFRKDALGQQSILITGGATGIGFEVARRCVDLGAKVVIASRNEQRLVQAAEKLGSRVEYEVLDIRSDDVGRQIQKLYKQYNLTALINNAAANFLCPSEHLSLNGFRAITETVMQGSFMVTQALAKEWLALGVPGQVVSIGVPYAQYAGPYMLASAMSKSAIESMTRTLSIEWADRSIRLNAVIPGYIETKGAWARLMPKGMGNADVEKHIPTGVLGNAAHVADAVVFMLLHTSIRGQVMSLDDGAMLGYGCGLFLDVGKNMNEQDWLDMKSNAQDK